MLIMGVVFALVVMLLMGYAFLVAKPNLPKISALTDYNPKHHYGFLQQIRS